MKLNKKTIKGFTIIEVMLVLVIAASIMLVFFLAVPALNRNSKNNQRRSDAGRIAAAINEYATNNNGALPDTSTKLGDAMSGLTLSFYSAPAALGSGATVTDAGTITYSAGRACGSGGASTSSGPRNFVIQFATETAGTPSSQCIGG